MLKALLANPFAQFLIGRAIGGYMLLVGVTTRWTRINQQAVEPFWRGNASVAACVWHGRFMLAHKLWAFGPGVPKAKMLISQSREGGVVVHASRTVGAEVIRGSASKRGRRKGAVEAMRAMARHLEEGGMVCMTPDGPKGPRMHAKLAPVQLAKFASTPLIAMTWSTSNRIVFDKSWDKFIFPLPFGRGALIWSDPIAPPPPHASAEEVEAVRLALERELNRISAEADRIAGVATTEPAMALHAAPAALDAADAT
jgi:lysophospholipid acyltransferase (LPLAT)-like uncharacterized protein